MRALVGVRRPNRSGVVAWLVALVALAAAAMASVALASPSAAQERPCQAPYGCPPTTPQPGSTLECPRLDPRRGPPGTLVQVTVTGVDPPNGTVRILFDGVEVASGAAVGGTAEITFTVPASAQPGPHTVTAVAANGSVNCGPGNSGFTVVAGADEGRGNDDRDRSGGGSLARTGLALAALLLAALVLIVVGRTFLAGSRRAEEQLAVEAPGRGRHMRRSP